LLVAVGEANARGHDRGNEAIGFRIRPAPDVGVTAIATATGRRAASELARDILHAVRVTHGTSGVSLRDVDLRHRHTLTLWSLATPGDNATWGAYRLRVATERGELVEASATTYEQSVPFVLGEEPQAEDFREVAFRSAAVHRHPTWFIDEQDHEQLLSCPPGSPELCPKAAVGGASEMRADEPLEVSSYLQQTEEAVAGAVHHRTI